MATAPTSLISGREVRDEAARTGGTTLDRRGAAHRRAKEKSLAAQRNGITHIIAPALNEGDAEDIPEHLREKLTFHWVDRIDQVLDLALEPASTNGRRAA